MTSITKELAADTAAQEKWDPEDESFWKEKGQKIASRTLWITTGALTLSFATWFMWSAIVVRLPELGFSLTVGQRFWLAALPGLIGATLRIPYSFIVQMVGTRVVVTLATASLLIPSVGVGLAVQNPATPFWILLLLAAGAGFGGGNFSAFMSSTSYFYPKAKQGTALGIQAGIGNLGVSLVQLTTPLIIAIPIFGALGGDSLNWVRAGKSTAIWMQNAAFIWVLPVLFFTAAAALLLRAIPVKGTFGQQAVIFKRKHNWIMTSLYFMTFGSFSGFSASFALLIRETFGKLEGAPDPLRYAFLGALIGSVARPIAGWISDKVGGARVTAISGILLMAAAVGVTFFTKPQSASEFMPFLGMMLLIFLAAGIGNGSTFRMIPVIFPPKEAGPVLGWTAAIGAYGAFLIPMALSASIEKFGSPNVAFFGFAVFYAANLLLNFWYYQRKGAEIPC